MENRETGEDTEKRGREEDERKNNREMKRGVGRGGEGGGKCQSPGCSFAAVPCRSTGCLKGSSNGISGRKFVD